VGGRWPRSRASALAANIALMTAAPYLISRATLVTGFAAPAAGGDGRATFAIARARRSAIRNGTSCTSPPSGS
jgi:hypothetical protein